MIFSLHSHSHCHSSACFSLLLSTFFSTNPPSHHGSTPLHFHTAGRITGFPLNRIGSGEACRRIMIAAGSEDATVALCLLLSNAKHHRSAFPAAVSSGLRFLLDSWCTCWIPHRCYLFLTISSTSAEMEMRAKEEIEIGRDIILPLSFSLLSHLYRSIHCSALRFLHSQRLNSRSLSQAGRVSGLLVNRHKLMGENRSDDEVSERMRISARSMAAAVRGGREPDDALLEEAMVVLCLVLTNAVEVLDNSLSNPTFCWINECNCLNLSSLPKSPPLPSGAAKHGIAPFSGRRSQKREINCRFCSSSSEFEKGEQDYGPKMIVTSIKRIKKREEATVEAAVVLCLVLTNAVEVLDNSLSDPTFCWINECNCLNLLSLPKSPPLPSGASKLGIAPFSRRHSQERQIDCRLCCSSRESAIGNATVGAMVMVSTYLLLHPKQCFAPSLTWILHCKQDFDET